MNRNHREAELAARMEKLGVREADFDERFIGGSGPGGQKINKTSSCVSLLHRPSGIEIQCQDSRSQSTNRYLARVRLCDRLEDQRREKKAEQARKRAKTRFQKRKRSKRQKDIMLKNKRQRSEKKQFRKSVRRDD